MSVNQKAIQYLMELNQSKQIIDNIQLEFRQLSDISVLLPYLKKFKSLKKLSLHGNRIKQLPQNLSQLTQLEQLDISNNILTNCDQIIQSLNTLPKLKRLICPFKKEDQMKIKQKLQKLEYINNSKIERWKPPPKVQIPPPSDYQLKQQDIIKVKNLYNQISNVYKNSYSAFNQVQSKKQFNEQINELRKTIDISKNTLGIHDTNRISALYLLGKYEMYRKCQEKILEIIGDIDPIYYQLFKTLLSQYSKIIKNLGIIVGDTIKPQKIVEQSQNNQFNKQLKKMKKLQKQIERLKKMNQQLLIEKNLLDDENKRYIDNIVRLSKQIKISQVSPIKIRGKQNSSSIIKNQYDKSPRTVTSKTKQIINNFSSKLISLKQIKQIIQQIYQSKVKFDKRCWDNKLPLQTMHQFLFTFLNQKYGLKNLTIEWASYIISGVQKYCHQDNDVAIFGKVLRNQCEQGFHLKQKQFKNNINQLLKNHIRAKNSLKSASQINEIFQIKIQSEINWQECQDIVLYLYNKPDSTQILEKIKQIIEQKKRNINNSIQRKKISRSQNTQNSTEIKKFNYQQFLKLILDHQFKKHEKYMQPLLNTFKLIDNDSDGIINEQQFYKLISAFREEPQKEFRIYLNSMDPNETNLLTFSQIYQALDDGGTGILKRLSEQK